MKLRFGARWLWPFIPQPRWLRRWYYRKSFQWWGHPSNGHWKGWLMDDSGDGSPPSFWNGPSLGIGERDVWGGGYCSAQFERLGLP